MTHGLTHSSGGRRLLIKKRNGTFWFHVEDGFSVIDMPVSDKLAEEIVDYLTAKPPPKKASQQASPAANAPAASQQSAPQTAATQIAAGSSCTPDRSAQEKPSKKDCEECGGSGELIGLFAGYRSKCPYCA